MLNKQQYKRYFDYTVIFTTLIIVIHFVTSPQMGHGSAAWWLVALAVTFGYWVVRLPGKGLKALWFNLAVLTLFMCLVEWFFAARKETRVTRFQDRNSYFAMDKLLGYRCGSNAGRRAVVFEKDKCVYDVVYNSDKHGLRTTPAMASGKNGSILFFGGSYTFGEGVNDNETFPYLVGEMSGLKAYNFGFHGYGTHQMLALLESGRAGKMVEATPKKVVYLALTCHIWRAAGLSPWDQDGPDFVVNEVGSIKYAGPFSRSRKAFSQEWLKQQSYNQLRKSSLLRYLYDKHFPKLIGPEDYRRFYKLTARARDYVKKHYPDAEFEVILWPRNEAEGQKIAVELEKDQIKVTPIYRILPGFKDDENKYRIDGDGHPNQLAHRMIAEYVVGKKKMQSVGGK